MASARRSLFWMLAGAALAFCAAPSALLVSAVRDCWRLLRGTEQVAMRPITMRRGPHGTRPPLPEDAPRPDAAGRPGSGPLRFVEFSLSAPGAREVRLLGAFADWKRGTPMAKGPAGAWEVFIPLAPGRHLYRFDVDGEIRLDPVRPAEPGPDGRPASVRRVPP